MPTNPLWLEHTEKAAWGTVEALRGEIERERRRLQRLTELQPAWPKLLALLDRVKSEHGIEADDPEQIVSELRRIASDRLMELDALKAELEQRAKRAVLGPDRGDPAFERPLKLSPPVRWFAKLLDRKRKSLRAGSGKSGDLRRLIDALDLKVEELAQARRSELIEAAVDVAHIALSIARRARRDKQRSGA
jgi:hypothetical protein